MNSVCKFLGFTLVLLLLSSLLFCDDYEGATNDTSLVMTAAHKVLDLLYTDNIEAEDYIAWESFTLNGSDLSGDYYDAYDNYEEDYFMDDTVSSINKQLRVIGDEEDSFTGWTAQKSGDSYTVNTHNQKKSVTMGLEKDGSNAVYLHSLSITDR